MGWFGSSSALYTASMQEPSSTFLCSHVLSTLYRYRGTRKRQSVHQPTAIGVPRRRAPMRHTLLRMLAACVLALTSYVGSIGLPLVTAGPADSTPHAHQALATSAVDPNAIVVGLNADMSAWAAEAGESIRRGIVL